MLSAAAANYSRGIRKYVASGILMLMSVVPVAHAQSQYAGTPKNAAISGTVSDQAGVGIPGSLVVLKAAEGFTLQTKTDEGGRFAIDAWRGEYILNVITPGFQNSK